MCEFNAPESAGPSINAEGSLTGRPLIFPFTSRVAYPIAARNNPPNIRRVHRGKANEYDFCISLAVFLRIDGKWGSEALWLLYR